ncbi:hypothetical protein [Fibrobacter sp. UWEL]|uniref:type IV toxin-antitoxin system AbiEi family antitoxin domain-containing protein n=1 Tax=Fibrobacter sp. UWEL TaxID=1896209 RepID=UPI000912DA82|nr:hypothetical protein [Fibrobacter sp. UWEL]SHL33620.1 Transcriptional regulator, AbiEi antitoxin, Type IV TA system [Fibrobacter sp. UWEL]
MATYDNKKIPDSPTLILRESASAYQYHQALQKVRTGEMIRLRPGIFASTETLAATMIDINQVVPKGVLCMYSAWFHHNLTTQIPSAYNIAIERKRKVVLSSPISVELYYWSEKLFEFGIEQTNIEGHSVHITDIERSVCDAIKYRNKIGLDLSSEIFRSYLQRPDKKISKLLETAKKLRVEKTVKSYLEVIL